MSDLPPVTIKDMNGAVIRVHPMLGHVYVSAGRLFDSIGTVALTPAQSATLRAALESAEKEMS